MTEVTSKSLCLQSGAKVSLGEALEKEKEKTRGHITLRILTGFSLWGCVGAVLMLIHI